MRSDAGCGAGETPPLGQVCRILVLKTCVDWCLRSFIEDFRREDRTSLLSLLTNSSDCGLEFERVFRYAPLEKLRSEVVAPETLAALRSEGFDRAIMLTTCKIPAMYRHVVEFARTLGLPELEVYFRHAPDGDYNAQYKAGFWRTDERGNEWLIAALLERAGIAPTARPVILDLGCGRGVWADLLHRLGCRRTVALDYSQVGLACARELNPSLWLVQGDAYRLPLRESSLDLIFMNGFSGMRLPLAPLFDFGRQCFALLRPGGTLIQSQASVNLSGEPGADPVTMRYFSEEQLRDFYLRVGYAEIQTFLSDRDEIRRFGAAALTPERTRRNAAAALDDIRFRLAVTIARKD